MSWIESILNSCSLSDLGLYFVIKFDMYVNNNKIKRVIYIIYSCNRLR